MKKLYFVCMGNYYRSRLSEELALHYAAQYGVDITVDSGGLSRIPNPNHKGSMARATLEYLANLDIKPQGLNRYPKNCNAEDVAAADIVILTDKEEQQALFEQQFPDYRGEFVYWGARDIEYDQFLQTPDMINHNVEALIKKLAM